jgi:NAD(P)-dependent dehydrogenase (short-subunit alcohol dehydrogenase family)
MKGTHILITGGYGTVGRSVAADLTPDYAGRLVVADRSAEKAGQLVVELGYGVRGKIYGLPNLIDPNPDAVPCKSRQCWEQKTLFLCVIRNPVQRSATVDRTLVMSRKAVRVRSSAPRFP